MAIEVEDIPLHILENEVNLAENNILRKNRLFSSLYKEKLKAYKLPSALTREVLEFLVLDSVNGYDNLKYGLTKIGDKFRKYERRKVLKQVMEILTKSRGDVWAVLDFMDNQGASDAVLIKHTAALRRQLRLGKSGQTVGLYDDSYSEGGGI